MKISLIKTLDGKMFFSCGKRQSPMTRDRAVELLWFLTNACFATQGSAAIFDLDLNSSCPNLCLQGNSLFPTEETIRTFEKCNRKKRLLHKVAA